MSLLLLLSGAPTPVSSSTFSNPGTPNFADFLVFLNTSVQIPTSALPANSPWPGYAYDQAIGITFAPPVMLFPGILYSLAVYNLATHLLFTIAPDQPDQSFFANARGNSKTSNPPGFGLNALTTGLVVASSDNGSSVTLTAPQWAAGLTLADIGLFQTPWGRAYLAYAQSYGPTIVGLT